MPEADAAGLDLERLAAYLASPLAITLAQQVQARVRLVEPAVVRGQS